MAHPVVPVMRKRHTVRFKAKVVQVILKKEDSITRLQEIVSETPLALIVNRLFPG